MLSLANLSNSGSDIPVALGSCPLGSTAEQGQFYQLPQ